MKWLFRPPSNNGYFVMLILAGVFMLTIAFLSSSATRIRASDLSMGLAGLTFILIGIAELLPRHRTDLAGYVRIATLINVCLSIVLFIVHQMGILE